MANPFSPLQKADRQRFLNVIFLSKFNELTPVTLMLIDIVPPYNAARFGIIFGIFFLKNNDKP
jgi:hypothetical protein